MKLEITKQDLEVAWARSRSFMSRHGDCEVENAYSAVCFLLAKASKKEYGTITNRNALVNLIIKHGLYNHVRNMRRDKRIINVDVVAYDDSRRGMEMEVFDPSVARELMKLPLNERKNLILYFVSGSPDSIPLTSYKTRMKSAYAAKSRLTKLQEKLGLEPTYELTKSTGCYKRRTERNKKRTSIQKRL